MRAVDVVFALAATLPLGAAGLAAGAALERAGVSAKVRERVFSLAFWLGPAASVMALIGDLLPRQAAAEITVVLRGTPLGALSRATRELAQAPHIHLPRAALMLLGLIALGAAFRLVQLGRAWLSVRALRRDATEARSDTVRAVLAAGLKPSVPVKLSAGASTPVAVGLLRPEILLPERFAAPEAATLAGLVCLHEAQHIGRGDNLRLVLEQLAGALLWFDPLRGVLHRRMLAAREERCDAAALQGRTRAERDLYARTLLAELAYQASPALAVGLTGAGKSCAMARISAIVDPQPANRRPALTLGLCAALACAAGGVGYAATQTDAPSTAWVRKVVSAVAAIGPASARAIPLVKEASAAPRKARGHAVHQRPIETAGLFEAETSAAMAPAGLTPSQLAEGAGDMVMFVNGDMDTGDLQQLVLRMAVSRGVSATADNRPQLEQAVLRSVADDARLNVEADYTQQFDSATRFSGNVVVAGDLKRAFAGAVVMVDGRAPPPGMVLSSRLVADAIEFKRTGAFTETAGRFLSVNIHGVRVAQ
jgi:beta-lactamase regulating signal transducer with metallopeptidase domain